MVERGGRCSLCRFVMAKTPRQALPEPPTGLPGLHLKPFDVVVVRFPFTDQNASKRRPALVLSSAAFSRAVQQSVLAMITSADQSSWPGDLEFVSSRVDRAHHALPRSAQAIYARSSLDRATFWRIVPCRPAAAPNGLGALVGAWISAR